MVLVELEESVYEELGELSNKLIEQQASLQAYAKILTLIELAVIEGKTLSYSETDALLIDGISIVDIIKREYDV